MKTPGRFVPRTNLIDFALALVVGVVIAALLDSVATMMGASVLGWPFAAPDLTGSTNMEGLMLNLSIGSLAIFFVKASLLYLLVVLPTHKLLSRSERSTVIW